MGIRESETRVVPVDDVVQACVERDQGGIGVSRRSKGRSECRDGVVTPPACALEAHHRLQAAEAEDGFNHEAGEREEARSIVRAVETVKRTLDIQRAGAAQVLLEKSVQVP